MRVLLVHNPKAGGEEHSRERLEPLLRDAGHEVAYRSIKEDGWSAALLENPELVVFAGGDGTVCQGFVELAGHPAPAAILPVGSANNIARTLGYPEDEVSRLVAGWSRGTRRPYDVWEMGPGLEDPFFVESMGGGIFADVLARASTVDEDSVDKVELGLALLEEIVAEAQEQPWELVLDGHSVRERLLAFEAMNIGELGPNIPLAPEADPGDGLLDVVLVRAEHRAVLSAYVDARRRGAPAEPPRLEVRRARRFTARLPAGMPLRVDDELVADNASTREEVTCAAAAQLEVLVPSRAA